MADQEMNPGFQMPRPGPEHIRLEPFAGTFRAEVEVFMGPGEPQRSTGTMTSTFQVGGLYLHQSYAGDSSSPDWPAFVGQGYWGYDFGSKKYEGFWIDNASTLMQRESGDFDPSTNSWTMESSFLHPALGRQISKRSRIQLVDRDHHRMETFMRAGDQAETLAMRIAYTRIESPGTEGPE